MMDFLKHIDAAGLATFVANIPADTADEKKAEARKIAWDELVRRLGENFAREAVERRLKRK